MDSLAVAFDSLEDPRVERTKAYPLNEIMLLVLAAVICGAKSWYGVQDFGDDRIDWLRKHYPYKNGIPSHDTIGRVMSLVRPSAMVKAYMQFMSSLFDKPEGEIIALDGKTLRRSFDKSSGQKPLHILNAWAVKSGLALCQVKVDSKTNEITAVPELLDLIDIKGATITSDAMNTQKNIAELIVDKGADYVLAVKGNHKNLEEELEEAFDTTAIDEGNNQNYFEVTEKGHGRVETRRYYLLPADSLEQKKDWKGIVSIGKVVSEVFVDNKTTFQTRYYILSFNDVRRFGEAVRGHWAVECTLHWVLDVTFREDECRVRKDHAPDNFSTVRKLALNLLRAEKSINSSIPMKQAKASRKTEYLDKIIANI